MSHEWTQPLSSTQQTALIAQTSACLRRLRNLHQNIRDIQQNWRRHFLNVSGHPAPSQAPALSRLRKMIDDCATHLVHAELHALFDPAIRHWKQVFDHTVSIDTLSPALDALQGLIDHVQSLRANQWPDPPFLPTYQAFYALTRRYHHSVLHHLENAQVSPTTLRVWQTRQWDAATDWWNCFRATEALDRHWSSVIEALAAHQRDWPTCCQTFTNPQYPKAVRAMIIQLDKNPKRFRAIMGLLLGSHAVPDAREWLNRHAQQFPDGFSAVVWTHYLANTAPAHQTSHSSFSREDPETPSESTPSVKGLDARIDHILSQEPWPLPSARLDVLRERCQFWIDTLHSQSCHSTGRWMAHAYYGRVFPILGLTLYGNASAFHDWGRVEIETDSSVFAFPIALAIAIPLEDSRILLAYSWVLAWIASVQRHGVRWTVQDVLLAPPRGTAYFRSRISQAKVRSFRSYASRWRLSRPASSSLSAERHVRPHPVRGHIHWVRPGYPGPDGAGRQTLRLCDSGVHTGVPFQCGS
ncbi:MAG: hypothetical protein M1294_02070 [Firmicutes bacterium]|nr:hypothetical protein [Bacillota bacterium]